MIRLPFINAPGSVYVTSRSGSYRGRHRAKWWTFHNRRYVGKRRLNPPPSRMFGGY